MKKILLIEDDKNIKESLTEVLTELNFNIIPFITAEDGEKYLLNNRPDLIICDVQLPGINGFEFLEKIQNNNKLNLIPFIFLTAKAEKEDWRKGMNIGADDYIIKPFKLTELLHVINSKIQKFENIKSLGSEISQNRIEIFDLEDKVQDLEKSGFRQFQIKDIIYVEASDQYTTINLSNSKKIIFRKPIKDWEVSLPKNHFIKPHRSYIINKNFVKDIIQTDSEEIFIELIGISKKFKVSSRKVSEIRKQFKL